MIMRQETTGKRKMLERMRRNKDDSSTVDDKKLNDSEENYILNIKSKKFHYPDCSGLENAKKKNLEEYTGTRNDLIKEGYEPCGTCNP